MSKLWLNVDVTRYVYQAVMSNVEHWEPEDLSWIVCASCYWVALTYAPSDVPALSFRCQRPAGDLHAEFAANVFNRGQATKPCAQSSVRLDELAPKVALAMTAALQLGGTNGVLAILDSLSPIEVGLSQPAVRATIDFAKLRPGSVRKK